MGTAKHYLIDGVKATVTEHARNHGRSPATVRAKMGRGMSLEEALHDVVDSQMAEYAERNNRQRKLETAGWVNWCNEWLCKPWRSA